MEKFLTSSSSLAACQACDVWSQTFGTPNPKTQSEELMDVLALQLLVATFRPVQAPLEGLHLPWLTTLMILGHQVVTSMCHVKSEE